jgi:hypothetical protein
MDIIPYPMDWIYLICCHLTGTPSNL